MALFRKLQLVEVRFVCAHRVSARIPSEFYVTFLTLHILQLLKKYRVQNLLISK